MNNESIQKAKEILELQAERTSLKTMADYVKEYLIAYCDDDPDFTERVNDPEKSFMGCIGYIKKKALEWLQEQQNLELSIYTQGIGGEIPPDICYEWAVEYYYSKPEPKPQPKKVENTGSNAKAKSGKKSAAKVTSNDEQTTAQISLMDSMEKQAEPISLFSNPDDKSTSEDELLDVEHEDDINSFFGSVEYLTDEEIANLPFDKEVA